MSTSREDPKPTPDEIDTLLEELLPPGDDPGKSPAGGSETHVPGTAADPERRAEGDALDRSPSSGRRVGVLHVAAASLAIAAIASVGGYWLGYQRSVEVAEPAAGEPPATTGVIASTSSPAERVSSPESEITVESLESELDMIDLSLVKFSQGTDRLTTEGRAVVAEIAEVLVVHPSIPVEVRISTFAEATAGQNHGLSTLQAEAVVGGLVAEGVEPTRLVAVGLGSHSLQSHPGGSVLLFDTDDSVLSGELSGIHGTAVALDADGALTSEVQRNLDRVADALAQYPATSLTLVAYAYASSPGASHDRSHALVDEAVAYLEGRGVEADRLSTVGMGDAPTDIDRETEVKIDVGASAAVSRAIRQVDTEMISFESGTDRLTPESLAILTEVSNALALDATRQVEISVHTYTETTSQENHDLSHRQGDAVAAVLVEAGAGRDRLLVIGHGDPPQFAQSGRDSYVTFSLVG